MPIRTLKSKQEQESKAEQPKAEKMEWTRSETLALAQQSCTFCFGLGMRPGRAGTSNPCNCVFRAIFRACFERFRYCVSKEKHFSRVSLETNQGQTRRSTWSLKDEEYTADFCLVSQRTLTPREYQIFRYHYLLGGDWKLVCKKMNMLRGEFFHDVYRIEQKLGRTFRELRPHSLFPVDEYFNGTGRYEVQPTLDSGYTIEDLLEGIDNKVLNFRRRPKKKNMLRFPIKNAA